MRHLRRTAKLGRKSEHRNAMLANMVCSLIKHKRITTTLAKAKAASSVAEKMVTLGKKGTMHDRRLVASKLRHHSRTLHRRKADREKWRENEDVVRILFEDLAPQFQNRPGGYTRIVKLGCRKGDASQKAILEWIDHDVEAGEPVEESAAEKAGVAAPKKEKVKPESGPEESKEETNPAKTEAESNAEKPEESQESSEPKAESETGSSEDKDSKKE